MPLAPLGRVSFASTLAVACAVGCALSSPPESNEAGNAGGGDPGGTGSVAGNGGADASGGRRSDAGSAATSEAGDAGTRSSSGAASGSAGSGGTGNTDGDSGEGGTAANAGTSGAGGSGGSNVVSSLRVISVSPTGSGVANDTAISVVFSDPMDTSSADAVTLTTQDRDVPLGTGVWSDGDTRLTLQPTSELVYTTGPDPTARSYTVTVSAAARDQAGNRLGTDSVSEFTTLRRVEAIIDVFDQRKYYVGENATMYNASATLQLSQQVGGDGTEAQQDVGLLVFPNTALVSMLDGFETARLDLYVTTPPTNARLTLRHIHSTSLDSTSTPSSATVTTTAATTTFPSIGNWLSFDLAPFFHHADFDLNSYSNNLQFLLELTVTGSPSPGTYARIVVNGGTALNGRPYLLITKLTP